MSKSGRFFLIAASVLGALEARGQGAGGLHPLKPYRVLLVVERWEDPASQIISSEKDAFQPVAALLKA